MIDTLIWLIPGSLAGTVAGWVACQCWYSRANGSVPTDAKPDADQQTASDQRRIDQIAGKIRTLTATVAADVSDHQSRVAEITHELQATGSATAVASIVDMVADLVAANQDMQHRLVETQGRLHEQTSQLRSTRQLANTDSLTGLANRRMFDGQIKLAVDSSSHSASTMVLVDIDLFKSINDNYGHQTGDAVLRRVAELMEVSLSDHGLCARYGGEEFAVLASTDDCGKIAAVVENFRLRLARSQVVPEDSNRTVTVSCGIAVRESGESLENWVSRTDKALYAAKAGGRNQLRIDDGKNLTRFLPDDIMDSAIASKALKELKEPNKSSADLPSLSQRQYLVSQMRKIVDNIDLGHVNLAAVAVRLPSVCLDSRQRETLLSESRSLLRSVDKIEFDDDSTLLGLMVTSDLKRAEERAELLLDQINHTLETFADGKCEHQPATLGVSMYDATSTVDDVIGVAIKRARHEIPANL